MKGVWILFWLLFASLRLKCRQELPSKNSLGNLNFWMQGGAQGYVLAWNDHRRADPLYKGALATRGRYQSRRDLILIQACRRHGHWSWCAFHIPDRGWGRFPSTSQVFSLCQMSPVPTNPAQTRWAPWDLSLFYCKRILSKYTHC